MASPRRPRELPDATPASVPDLPRWQSGWFGYWLRYPLGWVRTALRSRLARWAPFTVTGLGYLYASAPDFGATYLQGVPGFVGLAVFWIGGQCVTQLVAATELDSLRGAFKHVGDIISALSADSEGAEAPAVLSDPGEAIDALLRRAQEIARASLRPPADCIITAHVLVPEWEKRARGGQVIVGLRAAHHDDYRPDRSHRLIALDSAGAGQAFRNAKPAAVPDTQAHGDRRIRGRRYKSIGAYPIIVGEQGAGGKVRAVMSIDADVPNLFTQKAVCKMAPFIHPIAQLIGLALVTQERRSKSD